MPNDFYGYEEEEAPKGRDHLFLWTIFILILIGLAFTSWLGSFYIFGHPEIPRAYRILQKLNKIEPPRRFEVTAAPPGEFQSAQKLFERYSKYSRLELDRENAELLRNYISNYRETTKLVPYIKGRFNIIDSFELTKEDIFSSGIVALAQSAESPQVLIEHVYTATSETVPLLKRMLQTGLDMSIERTLDLSAIIHIERVVDGRLKFTVVPLLYGTYALKQGSGTFGLEPPTELNLEAGVPITTQKHLQEGLKKLAEFRRAHPVPTADASNPVPPPPTAPELVRLDAIPEGVKVPPTGALPEMPVATPIPLATRATPKSHTPVATPPVLAMNPKPAPTATPLPPSATPLPATTPLPKTSPQGIPLTPFIAANPSPGLPTANGGNWRLYNAGKIPPGRSMTPVEASSLADRGDLGERIYLRGQFVVTASGENKAVLRPQSTPDPSRPALAPTRIIVEFPLGSVPPNEGSTFARDVDRPFEVRDVRRGADGQINIYVREIIQQ